MIKKLKGFAKASFAARSRVAALILAIAVLCAGTAFAASPSAYAVDVYDGTEVTRVMTLKNDAEAIVEQAGVELGEKDKLELSEFTAGQNSSIQIYRAASVTFVGADGKATETVAAGTVNDLINRLQVSIPENMLLSIPGETVLKDGMTIRVLQAFTVTVTADGSAKTLTVGEGTVADALAQAEITLGENDEVSPKADTRLSEGQRITVYRVTYAKREAVTEAIPYAKKTVNSSKMDKGVKQVTQKGENGSREVVYRDKYVDGKLHSSDVVWEKVTKEAIPQITTVGTRKKPVQLPTLKNGGKPISELSMPAGLKVEKGVPTDYKYTITGKAAAYTAKPGSKTASGRTVKPGFIAVNPKQIPYGTPLWVVSTDGIVYGYAIAADTGGFVKKGKFTVDLFMNTYDECVKWGARNVIIYVL